MAEYRVILIFCKGLQPKYRGFFSIQDIDLKKNRGVLGTLIHIFKQYGDFSIIFPHELHAKHLCLFLENVFKGCIPRNRGFLNYYFKDSYLEIVNILRTLSKEMEDF